MTPSLSETERESLRAQDALFLNQPFTHDSGDPAPAAAHARHMARLLGGGGPSPCSEMVSHAARLFARSVPERPDLACRKGCAHCCHQAVVASAPEAFAVAAAAGVSAQPPPPETFESAIVQLTHLVAPAL